MPGRHQPQATAPASRTQRPGAGRVAVRRSSPGGVCSGAVLGSRLSELSPEEHAFLQRRIALFGAVAGGLMLLGFVLRFVLMAVAGAEGSALRDPSMIYHGAIAIPLLVAWLTCRGPRRTPRFVVAAEVFGIVGAAAMFILMGSHIPVHVRPDMIVLFGLAQVMFARTVYIPSTWQVTMMQFIVLGVGIVVSNYLHFVGAHPNDIAHMNQGIPQTPHETAVVVGVVSLMWWSVTALLCIGATRVIYGLRRAVEDVRTLGQYTLQRKLGSGGMGQVYEATHAMLRRPTAVKLLTPDDHSVSAILRFEREVQQTARLTHPNTITVFDYGRTPDGLFYYAMELIDGATLADIVELSGPQDPARVVHVLAHAAGALAEAHGVDLTHRDIKPANIMLCTRGGVRDTVKVLDFGLVKELSADSGAVSLTNAATVLGTPQYMPPEAITTPEAVDGRSDLYALGAVGYYLLTGQHVFTGRSVVEVCGHHLHTAPEPPSARLGAPVPPALEQLLLQCLDKQPDARPQSALALRDALRACSGVPPWSETDATRWWTDHSAALARKRAESADGTGVKTLAIDLAKRRRPSWGRTVFAGTGTRQ